MSYRIGPPPPPWKPIIIGDFVLSASGAGMLLVASVGSLVRGPELLQISAALSAPLIALSLLILVEDLGRPLRFWRMIRQLNPRSVMSWGSFILNGCFGVAGLAFVARVSGVQSHGLWTVIAVAGCAVAPPTLAYKGMLLSVTAVPLWRRGRLFGPLLVVDGICLGAGLLTLLGGAGLERVVASSAGARFVLALAVLAFAAEDRPLLLRGWIAEAFGGALTLSLVACLAPAGVAALGAVSGSIALRAALLRAPYPGNEEVRA